MSYFPHAYEKLLIATHATAVLNGDGTLTTLDLAAGQLGVVDAKTHKLIDIDGTPAADYATNPLIYLAQGSFHTVDKIGPFHGGYQETVKSKGINPKYVSAFYVSEPSNAVAQVVEVSPGVNCTGIACDTTYRLRLDVKGSPALRFLTHNAYQTLDAYSGCCDASDSNIDPNVILLAWKDQVNASPILSSFILAKVWNLTYSAVAIDPTSGSATIKVANADKTKFVAGNIVRAAGIPDYSYVVSIGADDSGGAGYANVVLTEEATSSTNVNAKVYETIATDTYTVETGAAADTSDAFMTLQAAYADTTFGNCSFVPEDHFELEPLSIYPSIVDELDNTCATSCFTTTVITEGYTGKGYGENLLRELIQFKHYLQEPYQRDPRMREVLDDTSLTDIVRTNKYYVYHILHSVPRKSNPTGTMDNDQYLIKIVTSARNTNFENWIDALLLDAGNAVQLEVLV